MAQKQNFDEKTKLEFYLRPGACFSVRTIFNLFKDGWLALTRFALPLCSQKNSPIRKQFQSPTGISSPILYQQVSRVVRVDSLRFFPPRAKLVCVQ